MGTIIEVNNLYKEYKQLKPSNTGSYLSKIGLHREYEIKKALENISFNIEEGEMVGYLGLNGAGKSTTVKILSGILAPTTGDVRVLGLNPLKERQKCAFHTATLFGQKSQLWWDLPVQDSLELARYMYCMTSSEYEGNYKYIDQYLDISEIKNIAVRQLSLGQKMRANLCFALLHNPKVLFLDEPTIGLDLITKQQVQDCIKTMNEERGTTLILTTHDVSDIESLCKRTILIDNGHIVFDDSLDALKKSYTNERGIQISFYSLFDCQSFENALLMNKVSYEKISNCEYLLDVSQQDFMRSSLFSYINANFPIMGITRADESLKIVLTKIYKGFEEKK